MKTIKTMNYSQFKHAPNRNINHKHVKRLMDSYRNDPHFFSVSPIVVTSQNVILDGQHRLLAAKRLEVPIYYMVDHTINTDEEIQNSIKNRNINQLAWSIKDYIEVYAQRGMEAYIFINKLYNKYNGFFAVSSLLNLIDLVDENMKGTITSITKNGNLTIGNREQIVAFLDKYFFDLTSSQIEKKYSLLLTNKRYLKTAYLLFYNSSGRVTYDSFIRKLPLNCLSLRNVSTYEQVADVFRSICLKRN